jgi:hypothetical protein
MYIVQTNHASCSDIPTSCQTDFAPAKEVNPPRRSTTVACVVTVSDIPELQKLDGRIKNH